MPQLGIDLALDDGEWGRLFDGDLAVDLMPEGSRLPAVERIGCLPHGMASGQPALELAVRLPDGRVVIAETSWALMRSAVRALEARWGSGE